MNLNFIRINDETILCICNRCNQPEEVDITDKEMERWKGGEFIQKVIPFVCSTKRELLISGICEKCFDELYEE